MKPRNLVFLEAYNIEFDDIVIRFTDKNGRLFEIEHKISLHCVLTNINDKLFYRTKNKKICQRIWIFVIRQKHYPTNKEKNSWILLQKQEYVL